MFRALKEKIFPTIPEDSEPERVAAKRGAKLLDEFCPRWHSLVNVNTLAMDDSDSCVLGQVYSDYDLGLDSLGLDYNDEIYYGFLANSSMYYDRLTAAWKDEVKRR